MDNLDLRRFRSFSKNLREAISRDPTWQSKALQIWFDGEQMRPIEMVSSFLSCDYRHCLIDAGLAFLSRVKNGLGVAPGPLTSLYMQIVDGFLRLPPPSDLRPSNISDINHTVCLYCSLFEELCQGSDSEDKKNFEECLRYILYKAKDRNHAITLFEAVFSHPLLRSDHYKLALVKDGVDFLKNRYSEDQKKNNSQGPNWKLDYKAFHRRKDYEGMIRAAISESQIMRLVYNYRSVEGDGKAAGPWLPYENSSVGVLLLMANFAKHANDHRRDLGLPAWTDQEIIAILEHHFPGEVNELFCFFFSRSINTDWGEHLKRCKDP